MSDGNNLERLDLQYKPEKEENRAVAPGNDARLEVGSSSLYGLVDNNITFHAQGVNTRRLRLLMWNWAWRDLARAFFGLFRVFLPERRE